MMDIVNGRLFIAGRFLGASHYMVITAFSTDCNNHCHNIDSSVIGGVVWMMEAHSSFITVRVGEKRGERGGGREGDEVGRRGGKER